MSEKSVTDTHDSGDRYVSETKVKPGIKTTEFWISLAAAAAGFVVAQGFVTEDQISQVVGVISPVVAAFGYSISRGIAKR